MNIPEDAFALAVGAIMNQGKWYDPADAQFAAQVALEAAAPIIAAQALERLADTMHREGGHFEEFDPKSPRAAEWTAAIQAYSKRVRVLADEELTRDTPTNS